MQRVSPESDSMGTRLVRPRCAAPSSGAERAASGAEPEEAPGVALGRAEGSARSMRAVCRWCSWTAS
jgi:hypothetical protein